jgi:hypothetical protein
MRQRCARRGVLKVVGTCTTIQLYASSVDLKDDTHPLVCGCLEMKTELKFERGM